MNRELFQAAVIDPPWEYRDKKNNDPKMGGITYPTLTTNDLMALPILNVFEKDAVLFVWVTMPKLIDGTALTVINAWGFKPITVAFTWLKTRPKAVISDKILIKDIYSGMGHHTCSNQEMVVLAKRGKGIQRINKSVKQVIIAPLSKHSEKPKELYRRIEQLYGTDKKYIEMFARKQNPPPDNWFGVGYDWRPSTDIRDFLKGYNENDF